MYYGGTMRLLLPLLCLCLAAQETEEPKRPKETLALIDRARSLPPEFCADVLLKLAESRVIPDAKWKRELIEEAFTVGAHAPLPYQRRAYGQAVESRWSQAYQANGLEALTLETRATEAMLGLDPQRGAAMFADIVYPVVTREKCDDPAVAVVDSYFETANKVFARGFSAKQRQKEEDLHFLERTVARMRSPAEVGPVQRLVFAAKVDAEVRRRLLAAFAVALDGVSGGDRGYGTYETWVVPGYSQVAADAPLFFSSLRGYIVRQVSGPRCSDHIVADKLSLSVVRFNAQAGLVDPSASWLKPITADEAKPSKDDG